MPFVEVNGAQIYYETFGQDRPGQPPIVLIHGSTGTGRSNWSLVAPLLARQYRVIVPDCRGHGQSSNPGRSYSFKEMAADTAILVRELGYERAHIIGHSNGGNVALVTLLEHPEIVQTCIPQAANAYVSQDLVEKEPPLFDPERVARERPDWMNEMIALHGPTHGPDYWRDLLLWTVKEIISEPNYTPEDLGSVRRPTLVIQGEVDRVNAPARHAQFLARHIPDAELWIPEGVGHTVHDERLFEWVERVLDFLVRRGNDLNDALYRLGRSRYADGRQTLFDAHVSTEMAGGEESLALSGRVLTPDQRQAVLNLLPSSQVRDELHILLTETTPWALVNRNVTDLRRAPLSLSERGSQALLGEAVRVLEPGEEWSLVRLERDGYLGYLRNVALHPCNQAEVEAYQAASRTLVIAEVATAYLTIPDGEKAGKLPFGVSLPVQETLLGYAAVLLPDGRRWWVVESDLWSLTRRPHPDDAGIADALQCFRRFVGVPYLWGGRTPFGFDCSGLASAFWGFLGVTLPRDADQQFRCGQPVEGIPQPGDLLFFGEVGSLDEPEDRFARISHVAISLGGDEVLHASGSAGGVACNSLNPQSPVYNPWLRENLRGVRRFV